MNEAILNSVNIELARTNAVSRHCDDLDDKTSQMHNSIVQAMICRTTRLKPLKSGATRPCRKKVCVGTLSGYLLDLTASINEPTDERIV